MTDNPELQDITIVVEKIEERSWTAPDNKIITYWDIIAKTGIVYSLWNPRLRNYLAEGKELPIKYSKKGQGLRLEQIVGIEQSYKGKGGSFRDRDYQAEHLGRLQNTILVAKVGVWDAEAEKNFNSAWLAYQKIANQYRPAPQIDKTMPSKAEQKTEPKADKGTAITKEAKDYTPKTQGELLGAARHYFGKTSQDISVALDKFVPSTPQELRDAWERLVKAWNSSQ